MSESRQIFTLQQVARSIEKTFSQRYGSSYWVKAEVNKLNYYSRSGHCFPELVQKENNKVVAQFRSHIWSSDFDIINKRFERVLKEPLKDGIKVLLQIKVTYTAAYGLSLHILDIDPNYTLGDLEREKQETILALKKDGVFNRNKGVNTALLPQRIAIISVETSKGYADFLQVIDLNPWGYRFFHMLFPSLLQGDSAVPMMIAQLRKIEKVKHHFDIVAIIRGGGGDIGLSCYNNENLAREIANFPLPVITGIGHATNETVAEMVSNTNAITPTKIGEYLIQLFHNFSVPVREAEQDLPELARRILQDSNSEFSQLVRHFKSESGRMLKDLNNDLLNTSRSFRQGTKEILLESGSGIQQNFRSLRQAAKVQLIEHRRSIQENRQFVQNQTSLFVQKQKSDLKHITKSIDLLHPRNVLKRGYGIPRKDGKALRSVEEVAAGNHIEIEIIDGFITSKVENTQKE